MSDPAFPDVPQMPGVPAINRHEPFHQLAIDRLTKDSDTLVLGGTVVWGIFSQKGVLAIEPDNIAAFEFQQEYRIADYPIESGSFESYNKVTLPFDIRVIMTKGGSVSDRKDFLDAVDAALASLDLFTIVTPERAYPNANLVRQDYRRESSNGASLLSVEIHAMEIRSKVSVQFSSPTTSGLSGFLTGSGAAHAPSGADPVSNGSVQALTPAQERLFAQGLPIDIGP